MIHCFSHYEVLIVMGFFSSRRAEHFDSNLQDESNVLRALRSRFVGGSIRLVYLLY